MARSEKQKLKLLYLAKFLYEKTDPQNPVTMPQILDMLENEDIAAERKSIYTDIAALRQMGIDIVSEHGKYYLNERLFEVAELKLLVDAVQDSRFITRKKSMALIKKMEQLCSQADARKLKRDVRVLDRVKTENERIFYTVNDLHDAICEDKSVTFLYNEWTVERVPVAKLKRQPRRNGERYHVSPWTLLWDDENYYLVAYDHDRQDMRHYRVDKIESIKMTDKTRQGKELFNHLDKASYAGEVFGMFAGELCEVRLRLPDRLVGVIADRFGEQVYLRGVEDGYFTVDLNVQLSPKFYSWVFALGKDVKLLSPQKAVDDFSEMIEGIRRNYTEAKE